MSNLAYLLLAVAFSLVASLLVWYRHRRPRSLEYAIVEFQRELQALAPDEPGQSPSPPRWAAPRAPSPRAPDGGAG